MNQKINVSKFARHFAALKQVKEEYRQPHEDAIEAYLKLLPYGSGIDKGIIFIDGDSTPDKLIFVIPYHHMDENGYYDGWTNYKMIIKPCLQHGYDLKITGRDKNYTKDYLYDTLSSYFFFDANETTFARQAIQPATAEEISKFCQCNNIKLGNDIDTAQAKFLNYSNVGYTIDYEGRENEYLVLCFVDLDKNQETYSWKDRLIDEYHFYNSEESIKEDIEAIFNTTGILIESL